MPFAQGNEKPRKPLLLRDGARGDRVTTVFVRQGKFALDRKEVGAIPPADLAVDRIADLLEFERPALDGHSTAHHATEVNR